MIGWPIYLPVCVLIFGIAVFAFIDVTSARLRTAGWMNLALAICIVPLVPGWESKGWWHVALAGGVVLSVGLVLSRAARTRAAERAAQRTRTGDGHD